MLMLEMAELERQKEEITQEKEDKAHSTPCSKSETRNSRLEISPTPYPKSETRNWRLEIRYPKPQNPEPETQKEGGDHARDGGYPTLIT